MKTQALTTQLQKLWLKIKSLCGIFKKPRNMLKNLRQKYTLAGVITFSLSIPLIILVFLGVGIFSEWGSPTWNFPNHIFPDWNFPEDTKLSDALTIISAVAGGIVLTINAIYIARRANAQDKTAKAQAEGVRAQVEANEQNLFNEAVKHLGSEKESVRIGGVYALCKLAKGKSTKEEYLANVCDILCAHVSSKTNEEDYRKVYKYKPSVEIQILLNLLTKGDGSKVFKGQRFDFSDSQLQNVNFYGAQLQNANFSRSQLQHANFSYTQLQDANFSNSQLRGANFQSSQPQGAHFWNAQLQFTDFSDARLQLAYFGYTQLQGTGFFNAQLQGANFVGAQLQFTNFWNAQLQGVSSDPITSFSSFKEMIQERAGKHTEMNSAITKGGLRKGNIEKMKEDFDLEAEYWTPTEKRSLTSLLKQLEEDHIGDPTFGSKIWLDYLADNREAKLGAYNDREADKIIEEYEKPSIMTKPVKEKGGS